MLMHEITVDTSGREFVDLTSAVVTFSREAGDGLLNVFVPHATAGIALIETGAGSEADLAAMITRLLPREGHYAHRHGSAGHGADHVLPAVISPSVVIPVAAGRPQLGTWQRLVLVDTNRDNNIRRVIFSLLQA
ncbi:MAG: secondary thiamine-phosphate synthase enzyme YjbQ [Dehalococcoidia bacterium]